MLEAGSATVFAASRLSAGRQQDEVAQTAQFILENDYLNGRNLEVDGGITIGNIAEVAAAGADTFVAGSAIFNQDDYAAVINQMRSQLSSIR